MRKLAILAVLACLPAAAAADHLDVIQIELKKDCPPGKYLEIVRDFNEWGKEHGYRAEVAVPLQSNDLASIYWLGRSANAQTFGAAWDAWRDSLPQAKSVPARLQARFDKCTEKTLARRGYDVY